MGSHRLGPHVVGQRVVVRHLLPDGRATDVLGTCLSWTDTDVVIERDGDGPVRIAVPAIVTGKPIPPRASVRARLSAREVELHTASLWDDLESVALGEWQLRTSGPGDTGLQHLGNSVLAMGDPGVPLAEAGEQVVGHYRDRGRTPLAQVEADSAVHSALVKLGWHAPDSTVTHCQLAPIAGTLRACNRQLEALYGPSRGREEQPTAGYNEEAGGSRLTVTLGDGVARGRAALDGDWLGLYAIEVDEASRRRGLGTAVVAELLDWGASRGARTAWLHVADDDTARVLTEAIGFRTHHRSLFLSTD